MGQIQEIELPDGTVVLARLSTPAVYGADDRDVGVLEGAAAKVERLGELISAVGSTVLTAARAVRPHEAAITFGVELTAKSGKALAVLAEGEAAASIQVTLTWHLDRQPRTAGTPAPGTGEATPADEPPAAPAPRAPVDERPASRTSVDERPASRAPVDERPASRAPVDERPASRTSVDETPASRTPADDASEDHQPGGASAHA